MRKKIFALITVLALALILVSCGPDETVIDHFISPNKILYLNTTDDFDGTKPKVDIDDFELYSIKRNQSVSKETVLVGEVEVKPLEDNIFEVIVKGVYKYNIYLYDEEAVNKDEVAVSVLSATYGITDENEKAYNVRKLFFTVIANEVDLDGLSIVSVTYGADTYDKVSVKDAKEALVKPEGYDNNIYKTYYEHVLAFNLENGTQTQVKNITYKPQDNQLPINTKMENNWIGYIWDWVLIIPISTIMAFFSGLFFNSFAVGILFTTIIVRTIAWPIYARANDMSVKMALAQPDLNRLQNKYALKKDPASQQKMQMETLAIYKKYGISVWGCLTPFMQMPIFLAMFQVVYRISVPGGMYVDKISNPFVLFGQIDLTAGGFTDVWSYVLAALVGVTMYLLQKISQKKPSYAKNTGTQIKSEQAMQTEKTMKTVSNVMIIMMVFTTISSVNALGFYWIIGNCYSLVQTLINRKLSEKKYNKAKQTQSIV